MPENAGGPIRVFFAYSHEDEALRNKLEAHLTLLQRQGVITTWHDRKITAGDDWEGEIDEHLEDANIILLLISVDFLASDYCHDVEMKRALERHAAGEARAISVILRPCDWQNSDLGKLQALPTDGRPVRNWRSHDDAFLDVIKGLRKVIEEIGPALPQTVAAAVVDIWGVALPRNPDLSDGTNFSMTCVAR